MDGVAASGTGYRQIVVDAKVVLLPDGFVFYWETIHFGGTNSYVLTISMTFKNRSLPAAFAS